MRKFIVVITLVICATMALTVASVKYSRIKIFVPDRATLVKIFESGIDPEGSSGKIGGWMEFIAGAYDRQQLAKKNISFTAVIDDLQKEDVKSIHRGPLNALGFGYGSMGGYYTFNEVLQQLDSMYAQYPNLITLRLSIATTGEGRGLWIAKISQNAIVDDPSKPEVLFTAVHHAREPEGMMTVIYYMWWLLQNYGTDPDATYLLNNRQIWFLPVFNPDGYVYNQTTNPGGGGYWRKNRRNNLDGTYGVDLNRNYGNYDMWNSSYGGSDTYTGSDVYRGQAPFSEPETNGLMFWLWVHNVKTCLNYHTFGDDVVYPWGYLPWESPDSIAFREFCFDMTGYNRYVSGVDMQTVGYVTRGNSDDFMYGDSTKPITFAMTPEVGPTFWPPSNLILPLAVENLEPNKYWSYVAGQYTVTKSFEIADQNHNGGIEKGEKFSLTATLKNKGLGDAGKIWAVVSTTNSGVVWTANTDSMNLLPARSEAQVSFAGRLDSNVLHSSAIQFVVTITDPSEYLHRDTLGEYLGTPSTLFEDHGDSGTVHWNTGVSWGISSTAHSAPNAFTDSPAGDYLSNTDNSLTLNQPIDLSGYTLAVLKFWTEWQVEPRYDFASVEISSNSGSTWTTLKTTLSHSGSGQGVQSTGTWGYDGYTPGMEWVEQDADISSYISAHILIRFRVTSDAGSERDGFYVDDIKVIAYRDTMAAGTIGVSVRPQWNLVSLPVSTGDARKSALYPGSNSPAYSYEYESGYQQKDTLSPGIGYWLRFPSAAYQEVFGIPVTDETIPVRDGWNLIGAIGYPIPCVSIQSSPPRLITGSFFGYNDGYVTVDSLWPGKGHWVKVTGDGSLTLSSDLLGSSRVITAARIRIVPTGELPPAPPNVVSDNEQMVPAEYRLEEAYPNPFNPSTTIRYQLPVDSRVKLNVYNLLGQVVAVLVNEMQHASYQSVVLNAGSLASGLYFYRLEATSLADPGHTFMNEKKIILLK